MTNATQELASRLVLLFGNTNPTVNQVINVLENYHIVAVDRLGQSTFEKQISYFLGAKRTEGLARKSADNYLLYLTMFSKKMKKATEDITTNDIRVFISYLADERGLKKSSIQSVINILRSFFGWMTIEELIPKNPMLRIKSFTVDRKNTRKPLSIEELEILRDGCKNYREKAIIEFMYSSGCRLSEATQIQVSDVDFQNRTVRVVGKGDKVRSIYFSVRARLMINEYLKERKGGTSLFASVNDPYGSLQQAAVQRIVREVGKRTSISRRIHPHLFRHTFATHLLNSGMDITIIQQLLGHNSVSTTQIYAELNQDSVKREYEKYIA